MVEEALQAVNFSAGVWGGLTSGSAGSMLMWVEVQHLLSCNNFIENCCEFSETRPGKES